MDARYIASHNASVSSGSRPTRTWRRPDAIACEPGASITAFTTSGAESTSPTPMMPASVWTRTIRSSWLPSAMDSSRPGWRSTIASTSVIRIGCRVFVNLLMTQDSWPQLGGVIEGVVRVGLLIDGVGGQPLHDAMLRVEGGRLTAVGPADAFGTAGAGALDLGAERVLMPGLVDCHAHPTLFPDRQDFE